MPEPTRRTTHAVPKRVEDRDEKTEPIELPREQPRSDEKTEPIELPREQPRSDEEPEDGERVDRFG